MSERFHPELDMSLTGAALGYYSQLLDSHGFTPFTEGLVSERNFMDRPVQLILGELMRMNLIEKISTTAEGDVYQLKSAN